MRARSGIRQFVRIAEAEGHLDAAISEVLLYE